MTTNLLLRRPAAPKATVLYVDVDRSDLVHTRLDCPEHIGLVDLVDTYMGGPCDDPDVAEHVAAAHGLIVPAHLVHEAHACPRCTLVAAPHWRIAA
jgi:hypothetical protein